MNSPQDIGSESLKMLIEKTIYEAYQAKQPGLVSAIHLLLKKGQLPTQIEQRVNSQIPGGSQVGTHVYLIACYLIRLQCPQN